MSRRRQTPSLLWPRASGAFTVAAAALLATPALASQCDERAIAARSIEDTAESIWSNADVIGFGYISTIDTPERVQQFFDTVVTLKGSADQRYEFIPLRVGRIGTTRIYRFETRPEDLLFLALVRTGEGYTIPLCFNLLMARDRTEITRRLVAMAAGGTGAMVNR